MPSKSALALLAVSSADSKSVPLYQETEAFRNAITAFNVEFSFNHAAATSSENIAAEAKSARS